MSEAAWRVADLEATNGLPDRVLELMIIEHFKGHM